MRVTVEKELSAAHVAAMYELYLAAFGPLAAQAAARHVLTADEFAEEMADPRIEKYVAWDDGDQPLGLSTLATDLSAVPWVSPDFYAARYPGHHARGAIFYLGFTLVRPDARGSRVYLALNTEVAVRTRAADAVMGVDVCAVNAGLPRSFGLFARRQGYGIREVDRQSYHIMEPDPPRAGAGSGG